MSSVQAKKLGDKYILLDLIGTGGMAEVYRSKLLGDKGFEKLIVIKKLLPQIAQDKEMVRLFIGEARLAALLQHENIAATYDFGEINGNYFLAMEYLFGKDLYTFMQRAGESKRPLEPRHALMITSKICEGMHYAHSLKDFQNKPLNIIHRDLTPHNIFITYDGKVKILDFGIARAEMLDNRTKAGVVRGKVSYMSPEQLSGDIIDLRSDIFSIGILLYEMISKKRMYSGDTSALIRKCISVEYEHLETIIRGLPPKLYAILHKALASDVESRYQSCAAMQSEIDNLLFYMSERPDSIILKKYIRNLFEHEYESDQKKAVRAMESISDKDVLPCQDKAVVSSPDSEKKCATSNKTVIYDTIKDGNRRKTSFRRRGLASICLIIFATFLFPDSIKEDVDTIVSHPAKKEIRPPSPLARPEKTEVLDKGPSVKKILRQAEKALAEQRFSEAQNFVDAGLALFSSSQVLHKLDGHIKKKKQSLIEHLVNKAEQCLAKKRLTTPTDHCAFKYYSEILQLDQNSAVARAGFQEIADRYASMADQEYRKFDFKTADKYVTNGLMVVPDHSRLLKLKRDLTGSKPKFFYKGMEKNIKSIFSD